MKLLRGRGCMVREGVEKLPRRAPLVLGEGGVVKVVSWAGLAEAARV